MSDATISQQVSRKLYIDVNAIIINQQSNNELLTNKIYNVIYLTTLAVQTADNSINPRVNLSNAITNTLENYKVIFQRYLTTKFFKFTLNLNGIKPPAVADDDQNRYIFSTLINSLANSLNTYVESDSTYSLERRKLSLDSLFYALTAGLVSYRKYFNSDISSNFITYSLVQDIASETSEERRSFFDKNFTPDQSIALNNVNINNPISYDVNNPQIWSHLFFDLINIVSPIIYRNLNDYFIRNEMFKAIQNIINDETTKLTNKINFSKDKVINVKEQIVQENGLNIKKIKIISPIPVDNNWLNRSIFYYTSNNAYSKSKISEIDSTNKTIKLSPYLGLTSQTLNQVIKLPTFKEGINIEKDFQNTTLNRNNLNLFSMRVIETNATGETVLKDVNFSLTNSDYNQNFINFPIATSNPLRNGWGIYSKTTDGISFYRDSNNNFILSRNQINTSGSYVYTDFYIDNNNLNSNINLSFEYEILNTSFTDNELSVRVEYFKDYISGSTTNYNVPFALKTFSKLTTNFNRVQTFSGSFNSNSYNYYRLKFLLPINTNNIFKIKFNNFYVGNNLSPSADTISVTNSLSLIKLFYRTNGYKRNKDLSFSYSTSTNVSDINVTTETSKIKISSEPYHIGSNKKIKFYNVNSNLKWLFFSNSTLSEQDYVGLNPITFSDTGTEKKYYDSFISLIKRIFTVLNAYALSKLLIPEAFDEENDQFNIGIDVTPSVKVLIQDLLDDLTIDVDFRSNFEKDPRSNFMQKNPQDNLSRKSAVWKNSGLNDALGLKKFTKFKNDLNKIKTTLKKAKSILDAIKAFVDILSQLIEIGEDILGALLEQVIKQVEGVVDNIASTGVYWLPLVRYFATSDKFSYQKNEYAKIYGFGDDLAAVINTPYPGNDSLKVNNSFLLELRQLNESNEKMMQDDLNSDLSNIGLRKKNGDNWNQIVPLLPFRSTTYEEFKNVIIDAFLDEDDLPELGLRYEDTKNEKEEINSTNIVNEGGLFGGKKRKGYNGEGNSDLVIKPGAPRWTKGSTSTVVIVCICLPAPEDLITGWKGFLKSFLALLKPIAKLVNITYTGVFYNRVLDQKGEKRKESYMKNLASKLDTEKSNLSKLEEEEKDLRKSFKESINFQEQTEINLKISENIEKQRETVIDIYNIRVEIKNTKDTKLNDFNNIDIRSINSLIDFIERELMIHDSLKSKAPESRKDIINQVYESFSPDLETDIGSSSSINDVISGWWEDSSDILENSLEQRRNKFSGVLGNYPDFVGMTLGSIIPGLFSRIRGFLHKLKKLNRKESTFSLSEKYDLMMKPITDKIKEIEEIIKSIDAIIDAIDAILGISLTYIVINSNGGVVDIIEQLENAEGFPNENKRQLILGGVLGAGIVDPNGNEFNFQGYFDEASKEFDELKSDLFSDLKSNNEQKGITFLNKFFS